MALFCSTCIFPICSPQSQRKLAIQRLLAEKSSISARQTANCSKVSHFTGLVLFNFNTSLQSTQCSSSSSSSSGPSIETESISPTAIIFVKGLTQSISERSLKTAFSQFGDVSKVKIILDKKTGQSLGFAYIWFSSEEFAQRAVQEMNGKTTVSVDKTSPIPGDGGRDMAIVCLTSEGSRAVIISTRLRDNCNVDTTFLVKK